MPLLILMALLAVPLVEIAVFVEVGERIGAWNTVLAVILTSAAGLWLLRLQGLHTLRRVQESLARNVFPVGELFDGLCLLAAGALLMLPGFVTDAIGLLLFVPPFRRLLRYGLWLMLSRSGRTEVWINGEEVSPARPRRDGRKTIEGDYREIESRGDDRDRDPKR